MLAVFTSFVKVVEQRLILFVAYLRQTVINCNGLVFAVLAAAAVSRVEVKSDIVVVLLSIQDIVVEVLVVPPETGAHADGCLEPLRTSISGIATDESS